ncbi:phosphoribosyl pyrophosphate synthase-associated protein 1-like isoform X2 [Dysidea avara]
MEMLILAYACKTSSARRIVGVLPYLPYSRQSKLRNRGCIAAKLLASMMTKAGLTHVITIDLHHKEIQGFFDVPVDNLRASAFIMEYIKDNVPNYHNAVIVARHPGVTYRASSYAERMHLRIAVIHGQKEAEPDYDDENYGRSSSPPPFIDEEPEEPTTIVIPPHVRRKRNDSTVKVKPSLYCVGDVQGRIAIIVDDVIDEVGELIAAAECLKENGAYKIYAAATHGILSKDSPELLDQSPIDEVLITNTVPTQDQECRCKKIKTIDISILLAEAVRRIYNGESMSYLFRNIPMEQ